MSNDLIAFKTGSEVSQESKGVRSSDSCDYWVAQLDNKGMKYGRW